jgi:hypothetical protein
VIRFLVSLAAFALALPALAQETSTRVPLDHETVIDGVAVACTGIGQEKRDPRWLAYPVQVEFARADGAYLADETLRVIDAQGSVLASVDCEGPWILLRPSAPGEYHLEGWAPGAAGWTKGGAVRVPATGRTRLVLRFPAG